MGLSSHTIIIAGNLLITWRRQEYNYNSRSFHVSNNSNKLSLAVGLDDSLVLFGGDHDIVGPLRYTEHQPNWGRDMGA